MSKKIVFIALVLCFITAFSVCALDFSFADSAVDDPEKVNEGFESLKSALTPTLSDADKSEVCWRLARYCVVLADSVKDVKSKRQYLATGLSYAEDGIRYNPSSYLSFFWRSACFGKDLLTRSVVEQMGGVDKIWKDYTTIVDDLKVTDYPEVWRAMGEYYWRHPFKSNGTAVSYLRAALDCVKRRDFNMDMYVVLAKVLYDRNWSASKRSEEIKKMKTNWDKKTVNSEKYAYYEGKDGASEPLKWAMADIGQISDRSEAKVILIYASMIYEANKTNTYSNTVSYQEAQTLLSKWK